MIARPQTIVGVIPARMAASRVPGKPLALLCGRPMLEHVYRRAACTAGFDAVYVATPDQEIVDAARQFGAPVVLTSPDHTRATDRVAEAARHFAADVVVNVQGDEPLIAPEALDLLCEAMRDDPTLACANLVNAITSDEDFRNPNQIKVVCDPAGNVLYMSRQPIPTGGSMRLRQLGIIALRRDLLEAFAALPPTPLEAAESIDVLRLIEHGFRVRAIMSQYESFGVDTVEDLHLAERRLMSDPCTQEWLAGGGSIGP